MAIDVQYLINHWEPVRELLTPRLGTFPLLSQLEPEIGEFSLLSGRRQFWDVFICLMAYAQEVRSNPDDVLRTVDFDKVWALTGRDETGRFLETVGFLRYCFVDHAFRTVPLDEFLAGMYVVKLVLAQGTMAWDPAILEDFEHCFRKHDSDYKAVTKCMEAQSAARNPDPGWGR